MRMSLLVSVLCMLPSAIVAQESAPPIRWNGNIRVRAEADMRDFNQKTPANTATVMRARLGVEARPIENIRVFLQLQDSRLFGSERDATGAFNTLSDTKNLDLHQGFIEIKKILVDELTLKLGRMELSYGNERIIGAVGWNNVGRSFDGAVFRIDGKVLSLDLLAMNTAEVQPYSAAATPATVQAAKDLGSDLYGAYATVYGYPNHKIDIYALNQWDRNQTVAGNVDLNRWTFGNFTRGKLDPVDYEVELAYQTGTRRGLDVSAYLLSGMVGYSLRESAVRRVALGYDYLSGTEAGSTDHRSFDPAYHTGHKFYGFMDYFIAFPAHSQDRGLTDLYLRTTMKLGESFSSNLWLHQFAYAQEVAGENALGQEVDYQITYEYNSAVGFELGVSAFFPDELMRKRFGGSSTAFWGYLSTAVSF